MSSIEEDSEEEFDFLSTNYINASYIDVRIISKFKGAFEDQTSRLFISTQGPNKVTIPRFWSLVIKHNVKVIFMLCNLFEDTRLKCDQYWPNLNETLTYDNMSVSLVSQNLLLDGNVIERVVCIRIQKDETLIEQLVTQYHVVCWPDHSVPSKDICYILFNFINQIIDEHCKYKLANEVESPIIVHCSAGIGRTGTLISLYNNYDIVKRQLKAIQNSNMSVGVNALVDNFNSMSISKLIETQKKSQTTTHKSQEDDLASQNIIAFSVFTVVRKLREQRYLSVSDICQYKLIYQFTIEWLSKNLLIESSKP